jgi:YD repeat-containing protein
LASLLTTKGSTTLQSFSYGYDNAGNITTLTDNRTPAHSQTFTYDALDRLHTATGPYGEPSHTYSAIGNLLSKAGVAYTYGATGQTCGRPMPHAVTSTSDGKSYSYDCNGNTVSDGERTFTWDADNKPVRISRTGVGTTRLAYSGDGVRVSKQGPTRTIRYAGGLEDHVTDGVQVKHILAGGRRVATRVTGGINAGTYPSTGSGQASATGTTWGA